jgi:hypothetical protein
MKYYLYISDTKVDMIFAQISNAMLEGLAGELKINLGVLSASFKQESPQETRFSKLEVVRKYLEKHAEVGTTDKPGEYFAGVSPMRWGPYGWEEGLVYFGGSTDKTIFGLGGSSRHMIGESGGSNPHSQSATAALVSVLTKHVQQKESKSGPPASENFNDQCTEAMAFMAVELATSQMNGPVQRLEFLAKRLLWQEGVDEKRNILLGTPLYVSMTD